MEDHKKITMEQAMKMSLAEYITLCGIKEPRISARSKRGGRRYRRNSDCDSDDYVDLDNAVDDDNISMDFQDCPKPESQQWRLLPPNNNRPPGMPPLVPLEADIVHQTLRSQAAKVQHQCNPNLTINFDASSDHQNGNNTINQKNRNWFGQRKQFYNRDRRNSNRSNLNADRHRIGQSKMNDSAVGNVHQRLNVSRWDRKAMCLIANGISTETVTVLERTVTNVLKNVAEKINSVANNAVVTAAARFQMQPAPVNALQQLPLATMATNSTILGENFLRTYMSLAPQVAGCLLEQINTTKEQQKYNMDVQKTISEIQGKPLVYASPGSLVVSSDGKGINCNAKPQATGMSMNQRFA